MGPGSRPGEDRTEEVDMVYLLFGLLAVVVVGALTMDRLGRRVHHGPRHLWSVARGTTRDGVTAHVQVEFTVEAADAVLTPEVEARVVDTVEDHLRRLISERTVSALPGVGDDPGWHEDLLVPGVVVRHAAVSAAEVEVTSELRRLVQDRRAA